LWFESFSRIPRWHEFIQKSQQQLWHSRRSHWRRPSPNRGPEEGAFITKARRLTMSGKRAGEGYFAASGDKIVFQSERDPGKTRSSKFSRWDLKTGETVRVSPGHGKTTCAYIHPTSGEVMFASTHLDPATLDLQKAELDFRESGKERRYSWDYDEHFDIFSVQPGTDQYVRLTDARGYDAEGAYSPDGTKIVFCLDARRVFG
jgi:Tol biopolymer transport system component